MRFSLRLYPVSSKKKVRAEVSYLYHEAKLEMKSRYISRGFPKFFHAMKSLAMKQAGTRAHPFLEPKSKRTVTYEQFISKSLCYGRTARAGGGGSS